MARKRVLPASSKSMDFNTPNQGMIRVTVDGQRLKTHNTWFRGKHTNFTPSMANLHAVDSVLRYVVKGWEPPRPMITPDTKIVAFGSCFAANITKWLSSRNFRVLTDKEGENAEAYVVSCGEGMVNTFVLRQQFEWAFENKVFTEDLWHGYKAESFGYDENVRLKTLSLFEETDVFIITIGLSEVWYDEVTGGVFWRAVPAKKYNPERHKFRVSSVQENRDNIRAIYELIKKYKPEAKIIFTLSPIPLSATFRDASCVTANSVSKAVLRAALDEVIREVDDPERLFYWPSYEIVTEVFGHPWKEDRRHVKEPILDFIMHQFAAVWCEGLIPQKKLIETWFKARVAAGDLQPDFQKIAQGRVDLIRPTIKRMRERKNEVGLKLLLAYADAAGIDLTAPAQVTPVEPAASENEAA